MLEILDYIHVKLSHKIFHHFVRSPMKDLSTDVEFEGLSKFEARATKLNIKEPIPQEIEYLNDRFKHGKIVLQPDFQRQFVWTKKKQKELIKSVWRGVPLPMFYFAENGDGTREVIDGQQRLTTLFGFINRKSFHKNIRRRLIENIKLKDENGVRIDIRKIKAKVLTSRIHCVDIPENKLSFQTKYDIFMTLNQGAVSLKPQEIRNCVFQREIPFLNHALRVLARRLSKLTRTEYSRMAGEELVLRFFVISNWGYERKVSSLLNSDSLKDMLTKDRVKASKRQFYTFLRRLRRSFPTRYFEVLKENERQPKHSTNWNTHIFTGKPNQGLFHLFSHYLPKFSNQQFNRVPVKRIREGFLKLLKNKRFLKAITGSATDSTRKIKASREIFEKEFIIPFIGDSTKRPDRNISREAKKTLFQNVPYCYLCYGKLRSIGQADHIKPWARGNPTGLKNTLLAHKRCNAEKKAASLASYRRLERTIIRRRRNLKNVTGYLKSLEKWNADQPLSTYKRLRKYAEDDIRNLDKR